MRDFLRKYLFHNFILKIVSLCLAVLLWYAVGHDPTVDTVIAAPVEFHNTPENLEMNSDTSTQVRVRVSGPERQIRALSPSEVHAVVDLQGVRPGERTFDLTSKEIHVPREIQVVQIEPSQFHINFDRSATRTVDVRPRVIGSFVSGYRLSSVSTDPATIVVVGPARRVNAIDNAITDPVDASGVVGSATFTTHAYVTDPLVRVQKPVPIHVTIATEKSGRGAASH
jgi:YbbR domain-containing protein